MTRNLILLLLYLIIGLSLPAQAAGDSTLSSRVVVELRVGPGEQLFVDGNRVSVGEFLAETRRWRKLRDVEVNVSADPEVSVPRLWEAYFSAAAAAADVIWYNYERSSGQDDGSPVLTVKLAPALKPLVAKAPIIEEEGFSDNAWYSCVFGMYHELYDPERAAQDAKLAFDQGIFTLVQIHYGMGGYYVSGIEGYWRPPRGIAITSEKIDAGGDALTQFCLDAGIGNKDSEYATSFNRAMRRLIDQQAVRDGNISQVDTEIILKAQQRLAKYLPDKPTIPHPEMTRALWEFAVFDDPFVVFEYGGEQRGIMFSASTGIPVAVGAIYDEPGCEADADNLALYLRSCAPRIKTWLVGRSLPGYDRDGLQAAVCKLVKAKPFTEQRWVRDLQPTTEEQSLPDIVFLSARSDCRRQEDGFGEQRWGYSVNVLPGYARNAAMSGGRAVDHDLKKLLSAFRQVFAEPDTESIE